MFEDSTPREEESFSHAIDLDASPEVCDALFDDSQVMSPGHGSGAGTPMVCDSPEQVHTISDQEYNNLVRDITLIKSEIENMNIVMSSWQIPDSKLWNDTAKAVSNMQMVSATYISKIEALLSGTRSKSEVMAFDIRGLEASVESLLEDYKGIKLLIDPDDA